MDKQTWRADALCATLTPEQSDALFFIGPGKSSKRARLFCQGCPVRQDCYNFAVAHNETGIWAGSTDEDRNHLDPFIVEILKATMVQSGTLESRNLNDFIPQVRHQYHQAMEESRSMAERLDAALAEAERLAAQLEALGHQFEQTIDPLGYAL